MMLTGRPDPRLMHSYGIFRIPRRRSRCAALAMPDRGRDTMIGVAGEFGLRGAIAGDWRRRSRETLTSDVIGASA